MFRLSTISASRSATVGHRDAKAGQQFVAAPCSDVPKPAESAKFRWWRRARQRVCTLKPCSRSMGPKLLVVGERPSMAQCRKALWNFLIATVLESLAEGLRSRENPPSIPECFWIF